MEERASSAEGPFERGQVLEGKFRVERVIGEGAMGMVVEATHLELEERVALKFLREEAKARPEVAARFAREARASVKIKNDHVARVYDVGSHEGSPFIVMEYLEGHDLEQLLEKNGPLDPTTAVEYVIQACEGLTAAHMQGVVHRDIKPGNLFLTNHGGTRDVKVLDFGISKAGVKKNTLEDIDLLTGDTTQIMGSPSYMSPEQIRSTKDVDARADIWSLGVVLYELIANEPPFDGDDVTSLIAQVLHEPHRPLRTFVPDIAIGLEEVISHCLEKDPKQRYQSAAELALALLSFAPKRSRAVADRAMKMMQRATGQEIAFDSLPPPSSSSAIASRSGAASGAPASGAPASMTRPRASGLQPQKSVTPWIALLAIVLGLGGGAFALFTRLGATKPEQSRVPAPREVPTTTEQQAAARTVEVMRPPTAPASSFPTMTSAPAFPAPVPKQQPPAVAPIAAPPKPDIAPAAASVESEIRRER